MGRTLGTTAFPWHDTLLTHCSAAPSEDFQQDDIFDWDPKARKEAAEARKEGGKRKRNTKREPNQRSKKNKAEGAARPAECRGHRMMLTACSSISAMVPMHTHGFAAGE